MRPDGVHEPTTAYDLQTLQAELRAFRDERDWARFHDPKSLILAMVGEVGELAELFQWIPAEEAVSTFKEESRRRRAGEEMSDILIYLLALSDVLQIDLLAAARAKLADSGHRFPVEDLRGIAPQKH